MSGPQSDVEQAHRSGEALALRRVQHRSGSTGYIARAGHGAVHVRFDNPLIGVQECHPGDLTFIGSETR